MIAAGTPPAPAGAWTFRASTPQDAEPIAALLTAAGLNPNTRREDLSWKYWRERADWPGSRSYILCDRGEIVAHGNIVPGELAWGQERARIIHVVDWAAQPRAVGAGVSLMKRLGRLADILLSVGGSSATRRILPVIGFRPHSSIATCARPLRPLRILGAGGARRWKLLPRLARSTLWRLQAPSFRDGSWEAHRIGPEHAHELAAVLPRPVHDTGVFGRGEALFQHLLQCPIVGSELYGVTRSGGMRGYFLLTFAPRQARLADLWIDSQDPADWRALIQCAVGRALQHPDAAELTAWASSPALSARFLECGFHVRGVQPVMLAVRGGCKPPSTLHVQMLDTDAAYLHHGLPELWL